MSAHDQIMAEAERIAALGESRPRLARDPVNLPTIRNWTEALEDANPLYLQGELAPPAMIQVWTMGGLHGRRTDDDPLGLMMGVLDDAGFTSVVATNCEQTYERYLRVGERVSARTRLESVVGPKQTGLGEGYFVTTRNTWFVGDQPVAAMLFRVLKFKPPAERGAPAQPDAAPAARRIRPQINRDTTFFWEGMAARELRIQRCAACGALRHPPGPMCPECGAAKREYVVSSGRGTVFSYVVHHHPPVPGKTLPFVVALVELHEGVRMLGELLDVAPEDVRIGAPVRIAFDRVDEELSLPAWRLIIDGELPELVIPLTPTFIVSTALATRDFQDVHHDRDRAIAGGSKDIFLNILTTTGLLQRFVTDWAGPEAVVRSISIRLGAPAYPYDTLTMRGRVVEQSADELAIEVRGSVSLGDHVTGTVRIGRREGER